MANKIPYADGKYVLARDCTEHDLFLSSIDTLPELLQDDDIDIYNDEGHVMHDGRILLSRKKGCKHYEMRDEIPFGTYTVTCGFPFNILKETNIPHDDYVEMDDMNARKVLEDIDKFLTSANKYARAKMVHKRGYLFYGEPGNGKTMLINEIVSKLKDKAYIFFLNSTLEIDILEDNKHLLKEPVVFIFVMEELCSFMNTARNDEDVQRLLSFMDGYKTWNKSIVIASTNYPELIPANFIDRPSRFDVVQHFDNPDANARETFIKHYLENVKDLNLIVKKTDGLSVAYLKELAVRIKFHEEDPISVIDKFNERRERVKKTFSENDKELFM